MKLSAQSTQPEDAIVRVEVTAEMLNETNPDGSFKYTDEMLREWLVKLRGDREIAYAKSAANKEARATKAATKQAQEMSEDDL